MNLEARYSSHNCMAYEEKLNASAKVQIYLGYESFKRRIKACKKFPCVWLLAKCIWSMDSSVRSYHVCSDELEIIEGSIALPGSNFPSDNLPLLITTSKCSNNGQGYFICKFVLAYSVAAWSTNANEFNMISWANSEPVPSTLPTFVELWSRIASTSMQRHCRSKVPKCTVHTLSLEVWMSRLSNCRNIANLLKLLMIKPISWMISKLEVSTLESSTLSKPNSVTILIQTPLFKWWVVTYLVRRDLLLPILKIIE